MKNKLQKTIQKITIFGEICSGNISGDKIICKNNRAILCQGSGSVQLTVNNCTLEDEKHSINTPAKTNFDAIRELSSIEQLVDILFVANGTFSFCLLGSVCRLFPACRDCILHWLRSPADLHKFTSHKQHSN